MALISIEEGQPVEQQPFQATVSINHGVKYNLTVQCPFSSQQEENLEWYFDDHLRFPFTDQVRAAEAAASIRSYGESLFNQVFVNRQAYSVYQQCMQAGLPTLQIEIVGSPAFQSLHWEALKDPDLPIPLSLHATMVRKNIRPAPLQAQLRQNSTLNLLIVTARPSGKQDVGYRTISRPLVELLRESNLPVQIELLRPGSYEALDRHLRETSAKHGVGYYQVIHFDVHGALLSYKDLQKGQQENQILFQSRPGRSDLVSYEGEKAFLFFEELKQGKADPVEASELANLLILHQVPIAILNASQSGKQIGATETSLGSRLMQAGVQLVLAMGYSVTVSAAQLLMRTLYAQLFAKQELSMAITMARYELYNRKERRVYFNQTLDLEDWLLPVVHQNQPVQLNTRPLTPEESKRLHEHKASRYTPSQPSYGFVGRDLDILQIEKRLLTKRNILLIRGMGGAGKTTLLHHLGWWWQTTQLVEEVFYFGYDERAWTWQEILKSIAKRLMSKVEYLQTFQPLSLEAQQSLLAQRLRSQRHVLILDNLESIMGVQFSFRHTLSKKEQEALHRLLKDLAGGQTLILLGSRGGEAWLAEETFVDNVYHLPGLDAEATSVLAERILERHGVTKYRKDKQFPILLALLNGFPLALEVMLANLARQTPAEVLSVLQAGDVQLNIGESQMKTENILHNIDYAYRNLSIEAQSLLTCLAPFTSVCFVNLLDRYSELLREHAALAHLPFDRWQDVLKEANNRGFLSPHPDFPEFLCLQPIFSYFLRTRLNEPEQAALRQAIETAFLGLYSEFSGALYRHLASKESKERQLGLLLTHCECENLRFAMNLALHTQPSIRGPYDVLSVYFNLMQDPPARIGDGTRDSDAS